MSSTACAGRHLADTSIAGVVYLADRLGAVLVEPAGVGKTELARRARRSPARGRSASSATKPDESKAIYEWNYKKQLLRIQADRARRDWETVEADIFRAVPAYPPLLEAIRRRPGRAATTKSTGWTETEGCCRRCSPTPDVDPRARHDRGPAAPNGVPHVQQHPRALEALKRRCRSCTSTTPTRAGEGMRGASPRSTARRRPDRAVVGSIRNIDLKLAVDLGDHRLGAHARVPRPQRDHARGDGRDAARAAQVPVRHHEGAQGARRRRTGLAGGAPLARACSGRSSTTPSEHATVNP